MGRYETDQRLGYVDDAAAGLPWGRWISYMGERSEEWMCGRLGTKYQGDLGGRDPGWDTIYRGWKIDVKWTMRPVREYPGLIVPTWKPRKAHIYVLVIGEREDEFDRYAWMDGWAYKREVEAAPVLAGRRRASTNLPAPYYFIGFDELRPMETLLDIRQRGIV